ncbi:hypothetical protein TNCV_2016141 [Trichonephila clavipes]|nr:hypothetical protein TNCV_2016141 [Trichonephila clavipes]
MASLGHQSLPPTDLGRVDEEMASPEQIMEIIKRSKSEPERKRIRMATEEDLETAFLVWFKQARSKNVPISG